MTGTYSFKAFMSCDLREVVGHNDVRNLLLRHAPQTISVQPIRQTDYVASFRLAEEGVCRASLMSKAA
jgi:hypothetical protein